MARITTSQNNFNTGEVSPRIYGRSDVNKYESALETATNCKLTAHGPVERRTGTKFIAEVKDNSKTVKLIPFKLSQTDTFILEFGDLYIRFFTPDGPVMNGGSPVEVVTEYALTDIGSLSVIQFSNVLYIANKKHAPMLLTRNSDILWDLTELAESPPPTYESGESMSGTLSSGATSGNNIVFTASSSQFNQADIGRQLSNRAYPAIPGICSIVSYISPMQVKADIVETFVNVPPPGNTGWFLDLSPISILDPDGIFSGSMINIVSRPIDPPELLNGGFDNSAAYWANISDGTGTIGWDSTNRNLELVGGGSANRGKAEQKIEGNWVGNFTIKFNVIENDCVVRMGTTSGGEDIVSLTTVSVGSGATIDFITSIGESTLYLGFENTDAVNTSHIDQVVITAELDTFSGDDEGKFILLNGGVVRVHEFKDTSNIRCEVLKTLNSNENTELWTMETETWDDDRGYPRTVGLYQQRLVFGGTDAEPQTLWLSETGIFNGFGIGPNSSDSIQVDLSSNQVNTINWIASQRDLIIGTSGAESTVSGSALGISITPNSVAHTPRTYYGSDSQIPVIVGSEIVFLQGSGRKVRTLGYDFGIDGYKSEDLTFLAEHITSGVITELSYTKDPDSIIYAVDSDGNLLSGTYQREQEVIGWSNNITDGSFENVSVISNGSEDQVWVVSNREINGATKRYIEVFDNGDGTNILDGFSDSFLIYSDPKTITNITQANPGVVTTEIHGYSNGDKIKMLNVVGMAEVNRTTYLVSNSTSTTFEITDVYGNNIDTSSFAEYVSGGTSNKLVTTVSGLDHLEGKEVQVKADGASHPNRTVVSGEITLDIPSYGVTVGLPYTTTIKTLRKEFTIDNAKGTMQGQRQRPVIPIIRVYKSARPILNGEFLPARNTNNDMDEAVPLFSGDLYYGAIPWDSNGQMEFTTSSPLPLMILGIFGTYEGNIK